MPDKSYWQDRQEKKFLAGEKKINSYYKELERSFEQSKKEIQKVINDFVVRYAIENDTHGGYATALRKLNKTEIGDLQAFITLVNANMGKYNQELNNMSMRARITRYQALEKQIDVILQQLYAIDYQYQGEELLKDVYSDSYYQTWFNIDQYHGFHQEFAQINAQTVEELIKYPFNGADFSTRLWKQKDHLLQRLNESITTMLIQGRNPMTLSKEFSKTFGTKEFEAYRLLHTEGSFMMGQGTLAAYKEDGVDKYQLLATLDIKTSDTCRRKDGEIYDVDKAVVGVTYWPFHAFCRTTDVPYYEDSDYLQDTRVARDPVTGKSYEVPADMTYKEWYKQYIESNPEAILAEKKWKNRLGDKKQFGKYQETIGAKYLPKSFDEFQNIKYSDDNEYGILKTQAKGMTYYNKAIANEPAITEHVKKVAESVGMDMSGLDSRLKQKDSYIEKIRRKYKPDGNEYEVKDIIRYTCIASPKDLTDKTLKAIDKHNELGYNTIEIKNYWMNKRNPYNGINTILKTQNNQRFEIQYHTPESFKVKDKMHSDYEKWRLMDKTTKEAQELRKEMFEKSTGMTVPKDIERVR